MNKSDELFNDCVRKIRRWPSVYSTKFPILPSGCQFVSCPPSNGQLKLEIRGNIFLHKDYVKRKGEIKRTPK